MSNNKINPAIDEYMGYKIKTEVRVKHKNPDGTYQDWENLQVFDDPKQLEPTNKKIDNIAEVIKSKEVDD